MGIDGRGMHHSVLDVTVKKTLYLLLLLLATVSVFAAPLHKVPQTLLQPNGDTLHCFTTGDEFFNYLHDAEGYTIVRHPQTAYYVYAIPDGSTIKASDFVAGKVNPAALSLQKHVLPDLSIIRGQAAMRQQEMMPATALGIRRAAAGNHGTMNNIVVFIRFSDSEEFPFSAFSRYGNACNDGTLSMKAYYEEVSYGRFSIHSTFYPSPAGATVVSYQDTHPRNYYLPYDASSNPAGYQGGYVAREQEMFANALNVIKSSVSSSLNLDMNSDGYIDNITFVLAGATGPWSGLLWPHRVGYFTPNVSINGKRANSYIVLIDQTFSVSVLCHETFHSLGAPDLYHYSITGPDPVGDWDIMCNDNLVPPQHMGAYMKYQYGKWIDDIPVISAPGKYTLYPLNTSPTKNCYKIPIAGSSNEFYVVEYRKKPQGNVFENAIPGSGLLVYRINTAYSGNGGYNGSNAFDELYIFRPNGNPSATGSISQAHFSHETGRTEFRPGGNPYPFLTGGQPDLNNMALSNITCAGDSISFRYKDPQTVIPVENIAISMPETIKLEQQNILSAVIAPCNAGNQNLLWSVANGTGRAHIDGNYLIGDALGTITLIAEAADGSGISGHKTITVAGIPVAAIQITVSSSIVAGQPVLLTAAVLPENATNKTLTWEITAGNHCAHIAGNYLIPDMPGSFALKATAQDASGVSTAATIFIAINPVTAIDITVPDTLYLSSRQAPLTATLSPEKATIRTLAWRVVNETGSAAINGNNLLLQKAGNILLYAEAEDNSGVSAGKTITILDTPESASLKAYWLNKYGADGLLMVESPYDIEQLDVFSLSGAQVLLMKGTTQSRFMQVSFGGLMHGIYIVRVRGTHKTTVSSVKVVW